MELQALLVLCGVGVAGAAVLLLMGLFSASGTSYEEAMAQQRRATTELLALAESKNKPKKNLKKANKKLAKKEKKESSTVTSSDHESEAPAESGADEEGTPPTKTKPHVEFTSDNSIDNAKIRKRGKVKPILINKEDMSCITEPEKLSPVLRTVNHFEKIHPKDEFELMHSSFAAEKAIKEQEKEISKPGKAKSGKQSASPEPSKEQVAPRERNNSGDAPKEQRKGKKSEKKPAIEEPVEVREEVIPPLNAPPQPSDLTTDKLLKQALISAAPAPTLAAPVPAPAPAAASQTPPGKGKKNKKQEPNVLALLSAETGGVSVSSLVRLVKEAAFSRTEIQILTDTLLNKEHETLPVHSEWSEGPNDPMQKLKKQLADKEKALTDEIEASQALHAKLKELRMSLNAERSRVVSASRAADESAAELLAQQARMQRLREDNHALAQEKIMLQSKLAAENESAAQRAQLELHIQRLAESEATLLTQLNAIQVEVAARAHEAGQARCDATLAQQHAAELVLQLQEANRMCAEIDAHRQSAIHAETAAQQEIRQMQERLNAMAELQNEVHRLSSRAQIAESNAEKVKEEADKQKQQLSSEMSSLKEQLSAREAELAELKQLKATTAPAQNGLPPSNLTDQHKAAELAKVEGVIESLRAELAAALTSSTEQKEQVASLREQLNTYQDKNNELRTKNWKVMEALQSAERALQSKVPSALPAQDSLRESITKAQEAQYNEVVAILKGAFPSASPPSPPPGRAWLETFAASLKRELEQANKVTVTSSPPEDAGRLTELNAQNEHLQGLVDKYKTIIDDTEGVLSRLQQNVTTEEQRWAQQLADKQQELDELRQRTLTQMQNKIDSLQLELRQVKNSNHTHSFADAERLTEERLLGGLSEKHKLNSSNGPLQVDLEEK